MEKAKSKSNSSHTVAQIDWVTLLQRLSMVTVRPLIEVFHGVTSKRIPLGECIFWGDFMAVAVLLRWDVRLFRKLGMGFLYPSTYKAYYLYCFILLTSGFWFWGLLQTLLRNRLIQRLTQVFIESGLKSPLGRLPAFIYDIPIDEFTRKLRLGRSCFSKEQFENAKGPLESSLQVYIDEMKENREHGSLDIIYSHTPMPTITKIDKIQAIPSLHFVIGKTRASQIITSLQKVPHLMVAGQTGGGKSTFLRGLITTFYVNNPNFHFFLIDLKGGLEFQIFENLPRVKVLSTVEKAVAKLKGFESLMTQRMELLKANECKDIDAFSGIPQKNRRGVTEGTSQEVSRIILVVDEAAEMFLAGAHASGAEIQAARRMLSLIARQGRSVGVHLIVATQRPDAKALDPQVKANLTGVVCFQMLNDASSITVLGVGRATELPAIPGRAIWKNGSEMFEVQTPFLGTEEVDRLLESYRNSTELKERTV